jgi:dTDP-4-dehydrorhamnose 3,5-epimerase
MLRPTKTLVVVASGISLEDFASDVPRMPRSAGANAASNAGIIDGVTATALIAHADDRGSLSELLTTRDGPIEPIVHVYQVAAAPGSVRAWVYHRMQFDRLGFTNGRFEVVLYDIRPGSPTVNVLNVFALGAKRPGLIRIPPLVIHGVRNAGSEWAYFVNMPTKAYDPSDPDKCRIPPDDPRVPYSFDVA